ncbi:glycosyltransferase family 4 protein [Candidatus Viridilinea mediisalina]|uniref:Glycosyl transferase family 1 n=1 Tax=Candidatus Viridilinea mediisalina TaxID=2024553 RepID=A0A2A6RJP9_9CHLR|nr:glycosyltransferase family 1 protein [Candidatus Viridilinea mediisalina]PDW03116.1 glycosyl transferase family 1 [Candidatus Viridilinea mediisalina]
MQIVINGSFWGQPNVGSGQYLHGLVRWLPQVAPQYRYLLLVPARSPSGPPPPSGVHLVRLRSPLDRLGANLAKLNFEQFTAPAAAWRLTCYQGPAVLLTPYFGPPLRAKLPVVTTVGDIIPLLLPEYRGGAHVRAYMALVRQAVRRSNHVLTFSAWSRNDILKHLRLPAERVTSIHLAAGDQYSLGDQTAARAAVAERYGLVEPFVYYVGGLDARKNLGTLLRAFALLRSRGVRATLAIAGRTLGRDRQLFPDLDAMIAELDLSASVRRIDVPPEDGPLLYRACSVFVFPSRYEGFGLPPLEAMACGAPVIVSDASSLPEVVGPAALRVPPDDIIGWAAALGRLLGDAHLRNELSNHGLNQAARFSYRRVAAHTLAILERVAR